MNGTVTQKEAPQMHLRVGVITHLVQAVMYGHVTIRFEAGRPTLIERHETVKLTGGERGAT